MQRRGWKSTAAYVGLLASALVVSVLGGWSFRHPVDNAAYDYLFRVHQPEPWSFQSVLLAIDERTLKAAGGMRNIRKPLAEGLRLVNAAKPRAVAIDVILADDPDPKVDAELTAAFRETPNLVLSSQLLDDGFEDPLPEFARAAKAVGHVHAQQDKRDAITRSIPLNKTFGQKRMWALSLEAFRLSRGVAQIEEFWPSHLRVGSTTIPVGARTEDEADDGRLMRVQFMPEGAIPRVSLQKLLDNPALAAGFRDKVVFAGVTAATEHDRLTTPLTAGGEPTNGIEINDQAFETMAQGLFITDVPQPVVLLFALAYVAAAGLAFRYLPGWPAYAASVAILMLALVTPYVFFTQRRVFSLAGSFPAAVLGTMAAAGYYHLVVRRNLRRSEAERARYQQAMHFVTHEMRTPLSAIQGSSELISRYALTEEKRKQIALLINSESKRLARMVEVFLNVERLSAGEMELKRESIAVKQLVDICVERTRPLADRKHIGIVLEPIEEELRLTGDRELMEYACYNLLTNAVKYSPQRTEVTVSSGKESGHIRIAVRDQGIGMDHKEVKQIFQKFYRTKKAEESGESGTGIGLSIVQQIVEQHGGEIEVISQPGAGSCFTLVLPAAA